MPSPDSYASMMAMPDDLPADVSTFNVFDDEKERLSEGARKTLALIDADGAREIEIAIGSKGFEVKGRPLVPSTFDDVPLLIDRSDAPWFYDPTTGKRLNTQAALEKITGVHRSRGIVAPPAQTPKSVRGL